MSALERRLRTLVEDLCSPRCAGRVAGTPEGKAARTCVIDAFASAGVEPATSREGTWEQPIAGSGGANIIGRIPGASPAEGIILLGAHYDHLGWREPGVEAFWGADDNAAAVAILVEVARSLIATPPASNDFKREILLCAFDGEEPPHFLTATMGSEYFALHPPLPLENIDLMVALDLVGHALGGEGFPAEVRNTLFVFGAELSEGTANLVDGLSTVEGVIPRRAGINILPPLSDYYPFQRLGVPFLFLTCGRWRHYHETSDTPDRLDYRKMASTAKWLEQLTRKAASSYARRYFLPDNQSDQTTLNTLAQLVRPLHGVWPPAPMVLSRVEALSASVAGRRLSPAAFTELLTLTSLVESALV